MNLNGVEVSYSLVRDHFVCPFCHRGFEIDRLSCVPLPPKLVCTECTTNYEAKIARTFRLTDFEERVARSQGSKIKEEQTATIARWRQLAESQNVYVRLRFTAMADLADKVRQGLEQGFAAKPKSKWD